MKVNVHIVEQDVSRCDKRSKDNPTEYERDPCPITCGYNQVIFSGDETQANFCKWVISPQNEDYTVIAHNLKGYDVYFVLDYLFKNGISPTVIYKDS